MRGHFLPVQAMLAMHAPAPVLRLVRGSNPSMVRKQEVLTRIQTTGFFYRRLGARAPGEIIEQCSVTPGRAL